MLDLYILRGRSPGVESDANVHFPQPRGLGPLFEGLMAYRIHQDNLLWERTNTLIAVQAGLFAGAYALRDYPKAVACVVLAGAFLSLALFLIMLRHLAHRDANDVVIGRIFNALAQDSPVPGGALCLGAPLTWRAPIKASFVLRGAALFFIAFDLYLTGVFFGWWAPPVFLELPSA